MPKTPRKNPTPRKLHPLSADELQQEEHVHLQDVELSSNDSSPTAVDEDSVIICTVSNSSRSALDHLAAAPVANVESGAQDKPLASTRRRSKKQTSTAPSKDPDSTVTRKTSAKVAGRCSKRSERSQTKVSSTRRAKITTEDGAQRSQTNKLTLVDGSFELHCANATDEYSCKTGIQNCRNVHTNDESVDRHEASGSLEITDPLATFPPGACSHVLIADNMCNEDINDDNRTAVELPSSDYAMSASANCGTSDLTDNVDMTAEVCMPTPQKNQLRFLSEELLSLNQESAHITTHVHRHSGTTPRRGHSHTSNNRRSVSTPRRFNILNSDSRSNRRSPRSTPRKTIDGQSTPMKVKFSFSTTPSKSQKESIKTPTSKKKSPCSSSILKFPTPNRSHTKRKLYVESPEHDVRKPTKVSRYVLII